jgi:hypothetical protein
MFLSRLQTVEGGARLVVQQVERERMHIFGTYSSVRELYLGNVRALGTDRGK